MLMRMTEADWDVVLEVFQAVRSRRGDKGRDDRRFLEALHYFATHTITWRALPVWRLSQTGVFAAFLDTLAQLSPMAPLVQLFDSTAVRARVSAAGAKGGNTGGHSAARVAGSRRQSLKVDLDGQPRAFHLTGGEASDSMIRLRRRVPARTHAADQAVRLDVLASFVADGEAAATHAPDADYAVLREQFSKAELVKLSLLIATINALNRLAIGFRAVHPA